MNWLLESTLISWVPNGIIVLFLVMQLASLIVRLTPTPKDDAALKVVFAYILQAFSFLQPKDAGGRWKAPFVQYVTDYTKPNEEK